MRSMTSDDLLLLRSSSFFALKVIRGSLVSAINIDDMCMICPKNPQTKSRTSSKESNSVILTIFDVKNIMAIMPIYFDPKIPHWRYSNPEILDLHVCA